MLPVCSSTGKISPALNQFQSCHNQGWKFNFFAAKTSILKTRGARLWIFWQLPDRVATTGQLTTGPAVWSISWGWGELVLDRLDLPAKKKCYEVWIFMWLLPPPRYSCRSAYAEKRKGSWRVLGRRPALLPTRRAEGNPPRSLPQSLHLRMVSDNQARKKEKKKRVNSASLKPVRITLRSLPCLCWGCSGCSQANHVPNASNPSAHHPEHQWRWIHATKADCEEGLQVHFCWSWASFTASGGSLLASIYPVTEALDFKFWQQTPRLLLSPPDSVSLSQTLWATASSKIL